MEYAAHINNDGLVQTCTDHCKNVAALCSAKLSSLNLSKVGYLVGILHDAGKFSSDFNSYIHASASGEEVRRGSVIHSFAGVYFILQNYHSYYGNLRDSDWRSDMTAELLAFVIGSHHGEFDCFDSVHKCGFTYRVNKQPQYDSASMAVFFNECFSKAEIDSLFKSSTEELLPYFQQCSNMCKADDDIYYYLGVLSRLILSVLIDSDRIDTAVFMSRQYDCTAAFDYSIVWNRCKSNIEGLLNQFECVSDIQIARRNLSDLCAAAANADSKGIYRLNIPTGGGKTLSGLRFALEHALTHKKKRIIYIAPLLSILEQNSAVIRDAIKNDEIILEHHSNVVNEFDTEEQLSRYELLAQTWEAPIIITTMVQFLNTLFSSKAASIRRFNALSDSVIIIDEVQSVPNKMLSMFNLALNFLSEMCKATIVLCSATQPCLEKTSHPLLSEPKDIIPKHILKKYEVIFKRNTIQSMGHCLISDISDKVSELYNSYDSILIVCNTKSEAERIFKGIEDTYPDICYYLSASMCMAHRRNVLVEIKERLICHKPVICVSTQVIEAGVDISFAAVIRLNAGMDSIVQSAGRCNRNGKGPSDSPVFIANCTDEKLTFLKEIQKAQDATLALLSEYTKDPTDYGNDLSSDSSINFYYEYLYKNMEEGYQDYSSKDGIKLFSLMSDNSDFVNETQEASVLVMRQALKTAGDLFEVFDQKQKTVIVNYSDSVELVSELYTDRAKFDLTYLKDIIAKLKPYTVSLFDYQLKILEHEKAVHHLFDDTVLVLEKDYYSNELGVLTKEASNECNTLIL